MKASGLSNCSSKLNEPRDVVMVIYSITLTLNEEKHIERSISSVLKVGAKPIIVDCGSTDKTIEIAQGLGAIVLTNPWKNYATQFNWGLQNVPTDADWVIRLDADEYITDDLASEVNEKLGYVSSNVDGIYCGRSMTFQGRLIRFGGVFPIRVLRFLRPGRGECENRWMDEHIKVLGESRNFKGLIIDDNLNSLSWWTEKHNSYASREAVDVLNVKYQFMKHDSVAAFDIKSQAAIKRWIKERIYVKLPISLRSFLYFFYRYFLRLGFLDGRSGFSFHFLQGFWYRYLVDAKVVEVERLMELNEASVVDAISEVLKIDVRS